MTIKDFKRAGEALTLETPDYFVVIEKHRWYTGKPSGLWSTDISARHLNICATYPRRIDAINGLDKLLRVFE